MSRAPSRQRGKMAADAHLPMLNGLKGVLRRVYTLTTAWLIVRQQKNGVIFWPTATPQLNKMKLAVCMNRRNANKLLFSPSSSKNEMFRLLRELYR